MAVFVAGLHRHLSGDTEASARDTSALPRHLRPRGVRSKRSRRLGWRGPDDGGHSPWWDHDRSRWACARCQATTVSRGSWRRARCWEPFAARIAPAQHARPPPRRHVLWRVAEFLFCTRCGAYARERVRNLGLDCKGFVRTVHPRRRLLQGRHPISGAQLRGRPERAHREELEALELARPAPPAHAAAATRPEPLQRMAAGEARRRGLEAVGLPLEEGSEVAGGGEAQALTPSSPAGAAVAEEVRRRAMAAQQLGLGALPLPTGARRRARFCF